MSFREIIGLGTAVLALAGLSVVIVNGGNTARVLSSIGSSFAGVIRAATLR